MNKRGQALVEFVIILPIFIFILMAFSDISRYFIAKNDISNVMDKVSYLVINKEDDKINSVINNDKYHIIYNRFVDNDIVTIKLSSDINILTPGLNKLSNVYVERSFIYE